MAITPPSPGASSSPGQDSGQFPASEDRKSSNEAITGSHPQSRILSPHLHLKNWMRSPGVKKRKVDVEDSAETKEKKDLSSDLEEEGTASDNHEDELEERRKYSTCDTNNHNNYTDDNK